MRIVFALLLALLLQACGSEPVFIADEVRFDVDIFSGLVRVEFDLNKDYFLPLTEETKFDELAKTWIHFDPDQKTSQVGVEIVADLLSASWPHEMIELSNQADDLKSFIQKKALLRWSKANQSLIYAEDAKLNFGGYVYDAVFAQLPNNFVAIQDFKDDRGVLKAKVAVLGPFKYQDKIMGGGLYYFAVMGENPFIEDDNSTSYSLHSFKVTASENSKINKLSLSDYFQMMLLKSNWLQMQDDWSGNHR